jgi:hypothetical protein
MLLVPILLVVPPARSAGAVTIMPSDDDATPINAVLANGGQALLVNNGKHYVIRDTLVFAAGAELAGAPGTIVELAAAKPFFRVPAGAHDAKITDITFDGSRLHAARPAIECRAPNFSWVGGGMQVGAPLFLLPGCDGALIQRVKISLSSSVGIHLHGGNRAQVLDSEFENNVGFGIWATEGSSGFKLSGNLSRANGIEMIGVTYSAHDGTIERNRVAGTGDNCISVSGRRVLVVDNDVSRCLGAGIAIYGDENTVRHNRSTDNGQVNNPKAPGIKLWDGSVKPVYHSPGYGLTGQAGIGVYGAFGGYGQNNRLQNNVVIDDQPQPTQAGISIGTGAHPWAPGHFSTGTYVYADGSTFKATTSGESVRKPSGMSEFRDGNLIWQWCSRPILTSPEAAGNIVTGNRVQGYKGSAILDQTTEHRNEIKDNIIQTSAAAAR